MTAREIENKQIYSGKNKHTNKQNKHFSIFFFSHLEVFVAIH
jgi:hypothetical protein